ncbi:hypothetical protein E5676_scaffold205G001140 [Cucumis melo var. makuwa]|uniref:Uncharacterized protein n=1 Tax=Cucumis melo var. makuwa TaxID=1194695 RepID=A0A5D3DM22_CUCMM|nr:hypothetical protein E6C27_scaffold6G00410 [Cucumis melo var. makuwa]TYK24339.1 hypothetical protein E5676_scaffold205G001140 [Cucumis melo var. makuwa]
MVPRPCNHHTQFSIVASIRSQSCLELATSDPVLNQAQPLPPIEPRLYDHRTQFPIVLNSRYQSCPNLTNTVPSSRRQPCKNLATTVPSSQSCPAFATNCAQTSRPPYPVLNRAQSSLSIMPSPCRHPRISNFEDHERLRRMREDNQEVVLLSLCSKTFTSRGERALRKAEVEATKAGNKIVH